MLFRRFQQWIPAQGLTKIWHAFTFTWKEQRDWFERCIIWFLDEILNWTNKNICPCVGSLDCKNLFRWFLIYLNKEKPHFLKFRKECTYTTMWRNFKRQVWTHAEISWWIPRSNTKFKKISSSLLALVLRVTGHHFWLAHLSGPIKWLYFWNG